MDDSRVLYSNSCSRNVNKHEKQAREGSSSTLPSCKSRSSEGYICRVDYVRCVTSFDSLHRVDFLRRVELSNYVDSASASSPAPRSLRHPGDDSASARRVRHPRQIYIMFLRNTCFCVMCAGYSIKDNHVDYRNKST